ncbi:catecholate siderophore receptor [Novosphingobium chloroacetimidivorans]|uniref:Catecholate siderophore receptor n=1 Tax=Novosphingobium chloroacetimidivorans TaxID=1428314 RepID=A0A7W7KBJ9_9SPHN|nr:TonB-dependent receptor [Novosphingobium chloroacetimidivorans]MBB4859812.1 catecholate siderophore receptor [Novosphingobium chloroacetimidivorans]
MSSSSAAARRTFLALSCIAPALACQAHAQQVERELGGVTVTDSAIVEEPGRKLESPKRTRTVRDTPQTITVLTNEVLEQQNLLTLRDALSTVPGITFGAGEGGTGPGDNITFRGYSASNDITIDGVRDSAQITRTDTYNLEQLEVTNGANSVISGAGSTGGNINLVTKRPMAEDAYLATGGVGTDDYYRATVDLNRRVSDNIAVRLNAMWHRNDVPGRDIEDYKRWGIAPSVTFGIEGPTRLTLQYNHQEDDNIPQYGVPYYNGGGVPGVHRSDYFGYRNFDKQKINVDQLTGIFEHEFSDTVSIRNLARWQDSRQLTQVSPPQGTYCVATSNATPTGAACTVNLGTTAAPILAPLPVGYYYPTGPRGNTRDTRNQLLFDQLDLRAVFNTGAIEHTINLGGAATWEKYDLYTGNSLRNPDGSVVFPRYPLINIANPNEVITGPASAFFTYGSNVYVGAVNFTPGSHTASEQTNVAGYLFDTMKLGKFELSAGGRLERNVGTNFTDTIATSGTALGTVTGRSARARSADTLFSYRVGLNYKPVEAVSLYVAYGNSRTPSKNSVNGSCTTEVPGQIVANTSCNINPESAKNYEVGAKAELFDGGLLLTASAFRNERDKYAVNSGDPTVPNQQLDGKSRVDGIALSASGAITSAWTITANYTYLKAKLIQSVSDYCLANPGATSGSFTCSNTVANPNPGSDQFLPQTPKHSGSLFTTYRLPFGLTIGYGFTYQGSFLLAAATPTAAAVHSDDFLIHQGYLAYEFSPNISAQLNVKNIGDKLYYTRIRNNGWATPGDARSAVLTLSAKL